ncbi:cation diffusion facilitator family transporter [Geomonas subterranea]|uniref:Cation diffusion facilitator family transporter n=1 Tax=Geomonas subterranea TaxID=2847989 RepID=A0ABX8LH31_9BACT|nr:MULTISPECIES: cation diffusion facilitator family transporter [Geomonas]QXE91282.1 cation diffusion facilitator family transporter [Geomonas subterranea]QXM10632.1 cation diffusion facilitator family transporter [Geomonas subterranea]
MASGEKAVKVAFRNNLVIFVFKLFAALTTHSAGMMAEAVHSLADTGNQVLLLFGMKRSKIPPTDTHPFGHGKEEYFWSFIVAMLLFVLGGVYSLMEGFHKLQHPEPLQHLSLNYAILIGSIVLEGQSWWIARRSMGKHSSSELLQGVVDSKDSGTVVVFVEDSGALLGLVFALVGTSLVSLTGNPIYDAASSLCIGALLFVMALFLANEMRKLMIGEAIDPVQLRYARRIINGHEHVLAVGAIRSMQLGAADSLLCIDVDFKQELHDHEVEKTIAELREKVQKTVPQLKHIFIQPAAVVAPSEG